jgi:hypothetical protein
LAYTSDPPPTPGAGQDEHVGQRVDSLNSGAAQLGRPEEFAHLPVGLGQIGIGEPPPGFQKAY